MNTQPTLPEASPRTKRERQSVPLIVLRFCFLLVAGGLAALFANILPNVKPAWLPWLMFFGVMLTASGIIVVDMVVPRKRIDTISAVYFGSIVGVVLTVLVNVALSPLIGALDREVLASIQLSVGAVLCYVCISLLLQTKDDFRFVIPYVEFSKEVKGLQPCVLDTSVVIDGRIADVVETGVLDSQFIMPRFVLHELQVVADSADKLRRARGRRGLDILNKLRNSPQVDLKIFDRELPEMSGQSVDMKLVLLAKHLEGKVITGDYNLNKVARLHNVPVINLNDVANALKPAFLPGETMEVRIVKPGEGPQQGVGYLDDGTMVVVEGGREVIGKSVRLVVTSMHQTSAGRMLFGRVDA